jgi:uncharacterized protein involved in high-affinity Fe2+ transport
VSHQDQVHQGHLEETGLEGAEERQELGQWQVQDAYLQQVDVKPRRNAHCKDGRSFGNCKEDTALMEQVSQYRIH